jgi:hypothetical protein
MEIIQRERRKPCGSTLACAGSIEVEQIVRQAIVLQTTVGTRGAVEYLKRHKIHGAVIGRVLSGGAIRATDQVSRDNPVAWD